LLDILIKGARLIDGSGAPWRWADVGIYEGKIVYVGLGDEPDAKRAIHAKGMIVCPGFIDIHSHADTAVLRDPRRIPKITQGVTTEVYSNCGHGIAPVTEMGKKLLLEDDPATYGQTGFAWMSVAEYLDKVHSPAVNVAYLVPHGTLRLSVMGYDARPASKHEIEKMCALLKEGMQDGSFGLSTGLAYVPMSSCTTDEIAALSKVAAESGGFLATHMRSYREKVEECYDEMCHVAETTGIPVEISHYQAFGVCNWGRGAELDEWIHKARQRDLDITFDSYPYDFSAGWLRNTIPPKYFEGGAQALNKALRDPAVRKALAREIGTVTPYDLNRLAIAGVNVPELEHLVGKTLPQAADECGKHVLDFLCDTLIQDPQVAHVNFQGNADDAKTLARSEFQMVGSDSIDLLPGQGKPHPRLWGTFPRFFRLYVKEDQVLSWEQAIYKMTGFPAWRLGLGTRGIIRPGYAADIVVFDPTSIQDNATIESPELASNGIEFLIVNGTIEIDAGRITEQRGGQVLKRGVH